MNEKSAASARACTGVSLSLTREQEGLWVEWKLSPLGVSYNTCIQMKLQGRLDPARFQQAVADVVSQFELLRAFCVEEAGAARLALSDSVYHLEQIDLTSGAEAETSARRNQAMAILTRRRDAAIDLTEFPLIRAALIRTDPATFYFIGVVPHIISDGYAAVSILKAISIAYNEGPSGLMAACGGGKEWSDYVALRSRQDDAKRCAAAAHWQHVLEGAQHIAPIRSDRGELSGSVTDTRGRRHFLSFSVDRLRRFNRLARSRKTSLFAVLAALYATLLHRQTGQEDLVIVFPVNVRPPGFRHTFGLFVNMIPLRVDLSGNPTFADLVEQIGRRRREDKRHQHLPGLDIVKAKREVLPDFDGRLSNVSMAQTVSRLEGLQIPDVRCTALDNEAIHVRDDLSLMYEVTDDLVGLWLEYRESSFRDNEIRAMAERLLRIIDAVDADADARIGDIELVDTAQRRALLALGKGPSLPLDATSYGMLFERSARLHACHTALRHGDNAVSYEALEAWTRSLARDFSRRPGPVAVMLNRAPDQIVTLLAALRAGVPYVPLIPNQAPSRTDHILRELQPAWLVCERGSLQDLGREWLDVHMEPPRMIAGDHGTLPEPDGSVPAYMIYTSGSTGQPKGVQVSHRALVNRISWLMHEFPLAPGETVLQNTSYAFDVSVAEIFWPLAMGATLVLSDTQHARDPQYLRDLIERHGITTLLLVPSALRMLLPEPGGRASLASLTQVLCAGEVLSPELARKFFHVSHARLFNVYGPTEATIYATFKEVTPGDETISIGRPIANTRIAVVNEALRLQPPGIEGELCVAGAGLADGYLGRQALTRSRFPQDVIDGGRWYRTGDRARLSADGEIFYLGRTDDQIKLRGHRIELGEIEHALRRQPGVADAAVVVLGDAASAGRTLAAWVACAGGIGESGPSLGHPLASISWRETLGRHLPHYMIPNTLHWAEQLPRLSNGKLDVSRLSVCPAAGMDDDPLPATPQQRAMAAVWAEVLDLPVDRIRLHSNFFELGGDSLMLIALATKLERVGLYIDVAQLFEHPTIAQALPRARTVPRPLINQSPCQGAFPALPRHRKFFSDGFAHPAHWNRTFLMQFDRHIDSTALQRGLDAVVRHHDALRSSFHQRGEGHYFYIHSASGTNAQVDSFDLSSVPLEDRHDHMLERINEANASLRLDRPLLLRVLLFDDERQSTLALVVHHLLIDMRSCHILLEDLLGAYRASVSHRPIRLPVRTTSIGEWSERLSKLVDRTWHVKEITYWEAQLRHAGHPIPFDFIDSGDRLDGKQHTLDLELTRYQTERLTREFCIDFAMGVHQVLLAGFVEVFRKWSTSPWLVVNTCGVGRDSLLDGVDLSRTVGELNTVFPLSFDLTQEDALSSVRRVFLELPSHGLHYGMLRYLGGHAELQKPEPDIFFNYVSRLDATVEAELGVTVEMAPTGVRSSHARNRNCYALYLEAVVHHGRLGLHIGYDSARFSRATMERVLQDWRQTLVRYVDEGACAGTANAAGTSPTQ